MTMSKQETNEWEMVDKGIKWNDVPSDVQALLSALKEPVYDYFLTTEEKEERRQSKLDASLVKMSEENIKDAWKWLTDRTDFLFTSHHRNSWSTYSTYLIATKPFIRYRRTYGARGKLATYQRNSFTVMNLWGKRIEKHWDNRSQVVDEQEVAKQEEALNRFERGFADYEQSIKYNRLTVSEIREKALKTFDHYLCGRGSSTLGDWSFSLSYHTKYIDSETGHLLLPPDELITREAKRLDEVTLPHLAERKAELLGRFISVHRTLFQMSVDWFSAMKPVRDKMAEVLD